MLANNVTFCLYPKTFVTMYREPDSAEKRCVVSNSEAMNCTLFLKSVPSFTTFFPPLQVSLNDSHNQMVVHWAGERSKVIVALARDSIGAPGAKRSSVRIQSIQWLAWCSYLLFLWLFIPSSMAIPLDPSTSVLIYYSRLSVLNSVLIKLYSNVILFWEREREKERALSTLYKHQGKTS